jgi:hypothetical protein
MKFFGHAELRDDFATDKILPLLPLPDDGSQQSS